jgi:hypothetical protein
VSIYSRDIIAAQTGAKTTRFFLEQHQVPARLSASGLAGSETVTLSAVDGKGATEVVTPVYKDGAAVTLKATDPVVAMYAPGRYEVTKSATAGLSGVFVSSQG